MVNIIYLLIRSSDATCLMKINLKIKNMYVMEEIIWKPYAPILTVNLLLSAQKRTALNVKTNLTWHAKEFTFRGLLILPAFMQAKTKISINQYLIQLQFYKRLWQMWSTILNLYSFMEILNSLILRLWKKYKILLPYLKTLKVFQEHK